MSLPLVLHACKGRGKVGGSDRSGPMIAGGCERTRALRGAGCWAWQESALLSKSSTYQYGLVSVILSTGQQSSSFTLVVLPPLLASSHLSLPRPSPCASTLCHRHPRVRLARNLAVIFPQHPLSTLTISLPK